MKSFVAASAIAGLMVVSGCALSKRDHVIVGSVPDDYRTNHPITIAEREEAIDIPVATSSHRLSAQQKSALEGFFATYDGSSGGPVSILVPSGGANDFAASEVSRDMVHYLGKMGIPHHRVSTFAYSVGSPDAAAPIRVKYTALKASAGKCGRWDADIMPNADNKHYTNFGCSYQNNLAAQIANPADLLGPRKPTEIDAENRDVAISDYKAKVGGLESEIEY